MKIALLSDLHVDHYNSRVDGLIDHLKKVCPEYPAADVCVVAGDIADGRFPDQYYKLFLGLRNLFTRVLVVTGNHDYYKSTLEQTHHSIKEAIRRIDEIDGFDGRSGVHFLNRSLVEISGRVFHGATMWYRNDPRNIHYEHWMNDVHYIQDFKKWVYEENELFEWYLDGKCAPGDIVITHHLPSMRSVPAAYKRSETNRFFVCDMESFIKSRKPALWLHGHTHSKCDYRIGKTRVLCNPRGYPRENAHGPKGYMPLIIEVP